jgi:tetratricopeptide (TPR) repeat protein
MQLGRLRMVALSRTEDQVKAALRVVDQSDATPSEKAEMLMEIALGLQQKPKSAGDLEAALSLYRMGLDHCPANQPLLAARIRARMATAEMAMPSVDSSYLEAARQSLDQALPALTEQGLDEEVAEAEMNLGLALQNLAAMGQASIQDAIAAYQRALRVFKPADHPAEFAILQNNLATAFLSIPFTDESGKMREALAVQAFEEGLKVVSLIDHPNEYAMLQNNLGNALQYVSSSHRVENGFRALEAYDEALKVRNPRDTPGEYANTIANKANCLANLPDDPESPEMGNPENVSAAIALYDEAASLFEATGDQQKAATVQEAISELQASPMPNGDHARGVH